MVIASASRIQGSETLKTLLCDGIMSRLRRLVTETLMSRRKPGWVHARRCVRNCRVDFSTFTFQRQGDGERGGVQCAEQAPLLARNEELQRAKFEQGGIPVSRYPIFLQNVFQNHGRSEIFRSSCYLRARL